MEPRLGSAEDRKLTLKVLGLVALASGVLFLFAMRPAPILGIDGSSLGSSVGEDDGDCEEVQDDLWSCDVLDSASSGGTFVVETKGLGCWDAWYAERPDHSDRSGDPDRSGCITLLDF